MSEVLTEKYYGIPGWAWALTGIGAVLGGVWLLYKYFVEPGELLLQQYQRILEHIYGETKEFLLANAELDPPIYGLTDPQQKIIDAKKWALEELEPYVIEVVVGRGESWVDAAMAIILAAVTIVAAPAVIKVIGDLLLKWRAQKAEASANMQSASGHAHLIFEMVANEFAELGRLNIASAFYYGTIPSFYTTYTQPSLTAGITYWNALLPTLIPGTMRYLVAQRMLTFMTYEISVVTGIMPVMHAFWFPMPLI